MPGRRVATRCAATVTAGVDRVTTVVLLRLRHQLAYQHKQQGQQSHQVQACLPVDVAGVYVLLPDTV